MLFPFVKITKTCEKCVLGQEPDVACVCPQQHTQKPFLVKNCARRVQYVFHQLVSSPRLGFPKFESIFEQRQENREVSGLVDRGLRQRNLDGDMVSSATDHSRDRRVIICAQMLRFVARKFPDAF